MFNNDEILKREFDSILQDVIAAYQQSGKAVTGNFADQLQLNPSTNSIELMGVEYLEGRAPGQMPPISEIEEWIERKGIRAVESKMSVSSLAFLIARKIAREGTKDSGIDVYSDVITPERIDSILKKISVFNANEFVDAVTTKLKELN